MSPAGRTNWKAYAKPTATLCHSTAPVGPERTTTSCKYESGCGTPYGNTETSRSRYPSLSKSANRAIDVYWWS